MFSIGVLELVLTLVFAVVAFGLYFRGVSAARWLFALAGCFALASVLTPADIASTLLFAIAFFGSFYLGTKHKAPQASTSV